MTAAPRWFVPVAVLALLWNALGCAAYLSDVTITPADLANMSADQQALYAARPAWAISATAFAVWGGAAGCVGLIVRKAWALPILVASLLGVIVQDVALFGLARAVVTPPAAVYGLQGLVLVVAIALVWLARRAKAQGWIA